MKKQILLLKYVQKGHMIMPEGVSNCEKIQKKDNSKEENNGE